MKYSLDAFADANPAQPLMPFAWAARRCSFPLRRPNANWDGDRRRLTVPCAVRWTGSAATDTFLINVATGVLARPGRAKLGGDEIARLMQTCNHRCSRTRDPTARETVARREAAIRRPPIQVFRTATRSVMVCGGIGAEAAHRAAEAVINIYHPVLIQSVGFAGALDPKMKVGNIFIPARVIDGNDGSRINVGSGTGTLLSVATVAGVGQKAKFANNYWRKRHRHGGCCCRTRSTISRDPLSSGEIDFR